MSRENARIVLTNDDGIGEPGLLALERAVVSLGIGPYHVIAPSGPCSGCGHRVTTHAPIAIARIDENHTAVDGTPADCVRLAIDHLAPGVRLILSGINPGGNLGTDVFHSGTVAAVREGGLNGIPGIALSHYIARGRSIDWEITARLAARTIRHLLEHPLAPGTFWNVNFPHPAVPSDETELVFCPVDPSPLPLKFRIDGDKAYYAGDYQGRARVDRGDVSVCFRGAVALSAIPVSDPGLFERPGGEHPRLGDLLRGESGEADREFRLADGASGMP